LLTKLTVFQKKQADIVFWSRCESHRDTRDNDNHNKGKEMNKTLIAVLAGFLAMGAARAQTVTTAADTAPHAYVGIGVGAVKNSLTGDRQRTYKLFGGYEFDQNWALEGGYTDLGKTGFYAPQGNDFVHTNMKSRNAYVAGKYTVPLTERSSVYAKLGLAHTERSLAGYQGVPFIGSDNGLYAAAGLQSRLTDKVSVYAEYERYGESRPNGPKSGVFNAGVKFGF
jgi:OOP family OmpA-OmpF porin